MELLLSTWMDALTAGWPMKCWRICLRPIRNTKDPLVKVNETGNRKTEGPELLLCTHLLLWR